MIARMNAPADCASAIQAISLQALPTTAEQTVALTKTVLIQNMPTVGIVKLHS
jgi:hypothetical protein